VAETKLDWARDHPRDPSLLTDLAIDRLPDLSVANVRAMLRAAMPLPDLTADRAVALVEREGRQLQKFQATFWRRAARARRSSTAGTPRR